MNPFDEHLRRDGRGDLRASDIRVLQVNIGFKCNQACGHCHLSCGPERTEMMTWETMSAVVGAAARVRPALVDLTGGAPEMHPDLKRFVLALRTAGLAVQVRTNLTAMEDGPSADLPAFFRDNGVGLVASMPCYLEENVRRQRGEGVYARSLAVLRELNRLGYGTRPDLALHLVHNPGGPFLPPGQDGLESDYQRELGRRFGLCFTGLYAIANMPIGRFGRELRRARKAGEYMRLLREGFNGEAVGGLMCRHQISIAWDGRLYDCDFNLALGLPVDRQVPATVRELEPGRHAGRKIVTGEHCFGCTAGAGSSCGGALEGAGRQAV